MYFVNNFLLNTQRLDALLYRPALSIFKYLHFKQYALWVINQGEQKLWHLFFFFDFDSKSVDVICSKTPVLTLLRQAVPNYPSSKPTWGQFGFSSD